MRNAPTPDARTTARNAGRKAKQAGQSRWVEAVGRVGLIAKGTVYGITALLAIQIPLGLGGKAADRQGAFRTVVAQPHGKVLLFALGAGLLGYSGWRLVEAVLDRDREGAGVIGLGKRVGYLGIGLIYLASAAVAFALVVGLGSGGGNEKDETARVLDLPAGRWIVGAVGLGFFGAGIANGYRSLSGQFRDKLREHRMADAAQAWTITVGVLGYAARAAVFALIGVFLVRAALQYDPKEAIGLDGALLKVADAPYGKVLLGAVAAGLLAYAFFCFVEARYRNV
jgi:uncharacterized protein DUF1206